MSYRFVDSFRATTFHPGLSKAVYKPVWHIPLPSVQWINSWWWAEDLPETCRVSCQNKFSKLVRLVGFIIKKFVTMHGHMNVKLRWKRPCIFLVCRHIIFLCTCHINSHLLNRPFFYLTSQINMRQVIIYLLNKLSYRSNDLSARDMRAIGAD